MGQAPPPEIPHGWAGILTPGERILWRGRPDGAIAWDAFRPGRALFGLAITGFAALWTAGALAAAPPGAFVLIPLAAGLFFFGLGLRHAGLHLVWDAYRRRHSWYTLTDRRAIIATEILGRKRLASYPITLDSPLTLAEGNPGDIWFATTWRNTKSGSRRQRIGFERVAEPRMVYDLMRQVQRGTLDDGA